MISLPPRQTAWIPQGTEESSNFSLIPFHLLPFLKFLSDSDISKVLVIAGTG